ncbi:hypothetical protein [Rheinheimera maricola]|uniref:Uncharacterized protein n=1 Tax=Rheinheimera maricola TaxID=2793282 RepID=A0ABS7X7U6_9GAMM|nr:hypothetical protein [Rheinheimera maricola]MBZ9611618.1 hypothetical protein [Rheinheimera maricola]
MTAQSQITNEPFMSWGIKILIALVLTYFVYQLGYAFYLSYADARIADSYQVSWTGVLIILTGAALDTLYRQHKRIKALELTVQQLQKIHSAKQD